LILIEVTAAPSSEDSSTAEGHCHGGAEAALERLHVETPERIALELWSVMTRTATQGHASELA